MINNTITINESNNNRHYHQQQQPICEAFIMTGQSMLKLSTNESGGNNTCTPSINNNNNKNHQYHTISRNNTSSLKNNNCNQQSNGRNNNNNNIDGAENNNSHNTDSGNHNTLTNNSKNNIISNSNTNLTNISRTICSPKNNNNNHTLTNYINNNNNNKQTTTTSSANDISTLNKNNHTSSLDNINSHFKGETKTKPTNINRTLFGEASNNSMTRNQQHAARCDELDRHRPIDIELNDNRQSKSSCNGSPATSTVCNDRDSARRLALRLFNLSGFKKSDVCPHLAKNNPFSQMVAEEYLNLFDFRSMKLDAGLRKFLSKLQLNGETQERESMLNQFSQRYYYCNKDKFPSSEIVQTLVCALILLNTDLHGGHNKKKGSKLTLGAFIDGLNSSVAQVVATSNNGSGTTIGNQQPYTFPRHLLVNLYESIRKRPLKCPEDRKCDMSSLEAELDRIYKQQLGNGNRSNTLPTRRYAPGSNAPSSTLSASSRRHLKQGLSKLNGQMSSSSAFTESAIEFRTGFVNRKRVFEANGSATSKGRRSWRRMQAILQDLRLIMRPESQVESVGKQLSHTAKQASQDMKNTVKIHHTFAHRSTSYTKRDNVFHLRLADQSEFLIQADSEHDMLAWIDTINFASACLSSPALPSAIRNLSPRISSSSGDILKRKEMIHQKPALPASYTKLSYWEQLIDHEERLQRLKVELDDHINEAPKTINATKKYKAEFIERIAYLKQEIERYKVYVDLMRKKSNSPEAIILSKHPQIASLKTSIEL